eukprot:CAMPEP_0168758668 /NCGR_PEP_ID=MMETSP0724-20121128/21822_1 /TAXON_ID=265536 /ORGANISM="Amphiprora sp., Strain CCMP467" /LENGTH=148 /DNA_ID=CAMNT_0008807559 /DNA_START=9 /DNA_END=455 /DNA_ORIENTATION=-
MNTVAALFQFLVSFAIVLPTSVVAGGKKGNGKGMGNYFEGYWIGIDPNDGGDTRRSIVKTGKTTYDFVARDSIITLCGGGEPGSVAGTATLEDEWLVSESALTCLDGTSFDLVFTLIPQNDNLMVEHLETASGTFIYDAYFWRQVAPY